MATGKSPTFFRKSGTSGRVENTRSTSGQDWLWDDIYGLKLDDAAVTDYKAATAVAGKSLFMRLQSALDSNLAGASLTLTTGAKHGAGADGIVTIDAGAFWLYPQAHTANAGISLDSGLTIAATATLATGTALTAGLELATGAGGIVLDSAAAITLEATTTARVDCTSLSIYPAAGTANQMLTIDVDTLDTECNFNVGSGITTGYCLSWAGIKGLKIDDAAISAYTAATGVTPSSIYLQSQNALDSNLAGSSIYWTAGTAHGSGTGGSIVLTPGGTTTGATGSVQIWSPAGGANDYVSIYAGATQGVLNYGAGLVTIGFAAAGAVKWLYGSTALGSATPNTYYFGYNDSELCGIMIGEDSITGPVSTSGLYLGLAQEARIRWNKDATSYPAACLILGLNAVGSAAADVLALSGAAITGFANTVAATAGKDFYVASQGGGTASAAGLAGATGTFTAGAGSAGVGANNGGAGGAWAWVAGAGGSAPGAGTGGAGGSISLTAGAGASGTVGGAGGNIVATPGAVGAGGSPTAGAFIVRQPGGVAGTDECRIWESGTETRIQFMNSKMYFVDGSGNSLLNYGISIASQWFFNYSWTIADNNTTAWGTDTDWALKYDETTTDTLQLLEGSVGALAIKGSSISGFSAAAATAGNDLYLATQTGGAASAAGVNGANLYWTYGAGSAGAAGGNNAGGVGGGCTSTSGAGGAAAQTGGGSANGGNAGTISWVGGVGGDGAGAAGVGGNGGGFSYTLGAGGTGTGANGTGGAFTITGADSYTYTRLGVGTYNRANITTTSTDAVVLDNATASSAGVTVQMTPRIRWGGAAYRSGAGAEDQSHDWIAEVLPATAAGADTSSTWRLGHSLKSAAYTYPLTIDNSGNLTVLGSITGASLALTAPLTMAEGGTGADLSAGGAVGDILIASSATVMKRLSGWTTASKAFLSQTGTGAASADPAWARITEADVDLAATARVVGRGTAGAGACEELALSSTNGVAFAFAANSLSISTSQDLQAAASPTFAGLALGAGSLTMTGSLGATGARLTKVWTAALESTADITINGAALATLYQPLDANLTSLAGLAHAVGDLIYATGAAAYASLADVAVGAVLVSGGVTTAPAYSVSPSLTSLTLAPTAALVGLTMTAALHTQTAGVIDLNCTAAATGVVGIDVSMTTPAAGLGIGESMYALSLNLIGDAQDNAAAIVYGVNLGFTANGGAAKAYGVYSPATLTYSLYSLANIYMGASDIETDTTTGMMIGTGATQKIGFYGATPVIQPAHVADPAACAALTATSPGTGADATTWSGAQCTAAYNDLVALKAAADANNAAIDSILAQLATLGLQASV